MVAYSRVPVVERQRVDTIKKYLGGKNQENLVTV